MILLKHGKNNGIPVCVLRETILKEMADKIKLSQHFFVDIIQELSDPHRIVFAHGNPYTELCVKHCTVSCQYCFRH
jgi:hypothetical protein